MARAALTLLLALIVHGNFVAVAAADASTPKHVKHEKEAVIISDRGDAQVRPHGLAERQREEPSDDEGSDDVEESQPAKASDEKQRRSPSGGEDFSDSADEPSDDSADDSADDSSGEADLSKTSAVQQRQEPSDGQDDSADSDDPSSEEPEPSDDQGDSSGEDDSADEETDLAKTAASEQKQEPSEEEEEEDDDDSSEETSADQQKQEPSDGADDDDDDDSDDSEKDGAKLVQAKRHQAADHAEALVSRAIMRRHSHDSTEADQRAGGDDGDDDEDDALFEEDVGAEHEENLEETLNRKGRRRATPAPTPAPVRRRRTQPRAQHCTWATWSSWGRCSKTCGEGMSSATRGRKVEAKYGGMECSGESVKKQKCQITKCTTTSTTSTSTTTTTTTMTLKPKSYAKRPGAMSIALGAALLSLAGAFLEL